MKSNKQGRVIRAVGGKFRVDSDGIICNCYGRGLIKRSGEIYPGDIVELTKDGSGYVVERVLDRKNSMIRPPVSNIDNVLIVIAPTPTPDFLLVDKLIINCNKENIEPIICYNKTDLQDEELIRNISVMYGSIVKTIFVSAMNSEGINELKQLLKGKFTCFAGQSAVGKSSIINTMADRNIQIIGEMSRIERGRNTTRHIELFNLGEGILIADTCGFSSLESVDMPPEELNLYYDEYMEISNKCKYKGCSHINEPNCAVKEAVDNGTMDSNRYNRYKQIYEEIKDKWSKRYE